MPYRSSPPLREWQGARRRVLDLLAGAAARGGLDADVVAQAYVVRIVAEFQAFARDLHDFAAERLATLVVADVAHVAHVAEAVTGGRRLDAGNPGPDALRKDFARFGVIGFKSGISASDVGRLDDLIRLRNALAHGNARDRAELARDGVVATPAWARLARDALDRTARRLDLVTWRSLETRLGRAPW